MVYELIMGMDYSGFVGIKKTPPCRRHDCMGKMPILHPSIKSDRHSDQVVS